MPLTTLQLASKTVTTHLTFYGDDLAITYTPGKLTKKEITYITDGAVAADQHVADLMAQCISRWVTRWDLLEPQRDEHGEMVLDEQQQPIMVMFPLDATRIADELPLPLTTFIVQSLAEASSVGEVNGTPSPNA